MEIDFDLGKNAENVRERGVPLVFGEIVLTNAVGSVEDTRRDYSEARTKAFANVAGAWLCCTYTMRGDFL
jgi:uncharacterized DUF497 family protein